MVLSQMCHVRLGLQNDAYVLRHIDGFDDPFTGEYFLAAVEKGLKEAFGVAGTATHVDMVHYVEDKKEAFLRTTK
ncbi:hypothetical protein HDU96_005457, partial [Phlyctochytrium bullatum]